MFAGQLRDIASTPSPYANVARLPENVVSQSSPKPKVKYATSYSALRAGLREGRYREGQYKESESSEDEEEEEKMSGKHPEEEEYSPTSPCYSPTSPQYPPHIASIHSR